MSLPRFEIRIMEQRFDLFFQLRHFLGAHRLPVGCIGSRRASERGSQIGPPYFHARFRRGKYR